MALPPIPNYADGDLASAVSTHQQVDTMWLQVLLEWEKHLLICREYAEYHYNQIFHQHNFHKHDSDRGHSAKDGISTSGNCGTFYLFRSLGYCPLVQVLNREMRSNIDEDFNGKCYWHDFCFDYEDKTLPRNVKEQMCGFSMPGYPKRFIYSKDNDWLANKSTKTLHYDNEFDIIQGRFKKYPTKYRDVIDALPIFYRRRSTVKVITWKSYLQSLPGKFKSKFLI